MRKIYCFLLSFCVFALMSQQLYGLDVSGSISTATNWGPEQVNVTDDLSISASVTIAAGTRIVVADQVKITVDANGSILANGATGNEIVFTAATPSMGWPGIYFNSGVGDDVLSSFEYTRFEYGKADGTEVEETSGGAVYLKYHSNVVFRNCTFENNEAKSYGGAINSAYSQLVLENCVFISNLTNEFNGGGAIHIVNSDGHELKIENCSFYNNNSHTGGAIHAEFAGGLTVSGSVFANNESNYGSAVTISQSSSNNISFISNTFVNNLANNSSGAVLNVSSYTENFLFVNNIIYGNENGSGNPAAIDFVSEPYVPVFRNCLIEGGLASVTGLPLDYTWTGMVDGDPEFVAPSGGTGLFADGNIANWQLSEQSPCINSGTEDASGLGLPLTDLAGNARIQQGRIDKGALESAFVSTVMAERPDNTGFKIWYRHDAGQIVVSTDNTTRFTGVLYNITGALEVDKRPGNYQNHMTFLTSGLRKGIYVVTLLGQNGKVLNISKIVLN
ncbi:right-handed parallel beta-helix repeat-containing protein [Marinilabilia sp.]|uniref:right-handed parallel beta-helix repeat-containing protein n=1 Tax=Marinilabilia sp. TaxID=2021252 RepID=UPI0025C59992|nr:right-handed parallel beta-helix repeat-containing protein [Marinilabilia sp.]